MNKDATVFIKNQQNRFVEELRRNKQMIKKVKFNKRKRVMIIIVKTQL